MLIWCKDRIYTTLDFIVNRKHLPFSIIASILLAIMLLVASAPLSISNASRTSETSVAYSYDVDGIRISKTIDGTGVTNYLVDKNRPYAQVLEERDGSEALIVSYIYGDDLISQERGGVDSYYHYDGQLSTRALSDSTATLTDTYDFDAFGNLLAQTGTAENNYLYTGEQYDPNTGFYYLRARYYDAGVGRFVTTDPWQGDMYEPMTLHRYLYTRANPVNRFDPSGEAEPLVVQPPKIGMLGNISGGAGLAFSAYSEYFYLSGLVGTGVGVHALKERYLYDDSPGKVDDLVEMLADIDVHWSAFRPVIGPKDIYRTWSFMFHNPCFYIPDDIWEKLTSEERRIKNKEFLDCHIWKCEVFELAVKVSKGQWAIGFYPNAPTFGWELRYLKENKYKLSEDGQRLIPPC